VQMIERADDDTKTTAFAVAINLKLVFSAGTDTGRAENQALVERTFGDDIGQPHVTEDENTHRDTDGNLSVPSATRGPAYRPASPSVASSTMVDRSVDGEEDEDWLDEWTTEDRMARLADTHRIPVSKLELKRLLGTIPKSQLQPRQGRF
jgi:hypothetical protein